MTNEDKPGAFKSMILPLIAASLLALPACGKKESTQATEANAQAAREQRGLEVRMAKKAVELLYDHADYMNGLGGDPSLTMENFAEKLASSMNSAGVPGAGDPVTPGPKFTFVANRLSGPWQVVLKVEGEALRATAYGSDIAVPLESRSLEIRRR